MNHVRNGMLSHHASRGHAGWQLHILLWAPVLLLIAACTAAPDETDIPFAEPSETSPSSTASSTQADLPEPEPEATEPQPTLAPLPTVSEDDWSRGPLDAAATIVVYSDFQ